MRRLLRGAAITTVIVGSALGVSCRPTSWGPPLAARLCNASAPVQSGTLRDGRINELSGLAASRTHAGVLWAHNDSGDQPRLFAFDRYGNSRATVAVSNAVNSDWEDLAAYRRTLYIGDIGDNTRSRPSIQVYRLNEPGLGAASAPATRFELRYPDGPHDAEALMVDPVGRQLVVVTKEANGRSGIYATSLASPGALQRVTTLNLGNGSFVTAGDIAESGGVVVLRTYGSVLVWDRRGGEHLSATFGRAPCRPAAAVERQGEALALSPHAGGYTTVSEGVGSPVWQTTAR